MAKAVKRYRPKRVNRHLFPTTGQTYRLTRASHGHQFHTASTVKVGVLTALLLDNNGQLNDTENNLAQAMIENSDNDATSTLFENYIGSKEGLQKSMMKSV